MVVGMGAGVSTIKRFHPSFQIIFIFNHFHAHTTFSSSFPFVPYFESAVRNLRRAVRKGTLHFWVETKVQDAKLLQCAFVERMMIQRLMEYSRS